MNKREKALVKAAKSLLRLHEEGAYTVHACGDVAPKEWTKTINALKDCLVRYGEDNTEEGNLRHERLVVLDVALSLLSAHVGPSDEDGIRLVGKARAALKEL